MPPWWFPDRRQAALIRSRVEARSQLGRDPIETGILQPSVLEAALERATWGPWPAGDIWTRVALLLRGIVQEHPFVDGNKRTGFEIADATLAVNGWILVASAEEVVALQLAVAQGKMDIEEIAAWRRRHAERVKTGGVES